MPESARTIDISAELVTLLGPSQSIAANLPPGRIALVIQVEQPARLCIHLGQEGIAGEQLGQGSIVLAVRGDALASLFDWSPNVCEPQRFYLGNGQAAIARSLFEKRDCEGATATYRLAKSIELLCELVGALKAGTLTPMPDDALLSRNDLERVTLARQIIDEQWSEKLTIDHLARRCGLNRSKLTKGFREVYRSSISEALVERRLAEARRQLLGTDLPVGVIGYRSGYLNNASFTRAFGRRYGVSPSDFRSLRAA
ncbi:AraC family transcriptional regulator [Sphingomonas sp. BN140010]|uniref:AraC family transcriptional regulator n=1 Tax=Sphingomonas arvum TaxID=2992113 RepID=A0ABT3JEW5_9SPHN|nr:AraC family transcriptional regulator [Sphingomonas sp. BN140010]MCW3797613.1 AraC family transcriptional regulator [Sphingomonas sp. BN140010]